MSDEPVYLEIRPPPALNDIVAIRFRPGGARPFLRTPASELVDGGAPLEALWGPAGADLPDRLYETEGDEARANLPGGRHRTRGCGGGGR